MPPTVRRFRLLRMPRMADFARWATAAEPALGWPAGTFLRAYAGARESAVDLALEASPVAVEIRRFVDGRGVEVWEGTATELLAAQWISGNPSTWLDRVTGI